MYLWTKDDIPTVIFSTTQISVGKIKFCIRTYISRKFCRIEGKMCVGVCTVIRRYDRIFMQS